uniref:Homeobox domain-containing protein n=1 Tax=Xiphophorus couchianus TaxID=32473 RepID=A0A3B5M3S5_9TELE
MASNVSLWLNVSLIPNVCVCVPTLWFLPLCLCVHRLVARPCAHILQIQAGAPRRVQPNAVLERLYQSNTVHKDTRQLEGLSKQLDWEERKIQRWFRIRRNQDRPSTQKKFCESIAGTLVMCVHDASDVFLEAAKLANYAKYQRLCDSLFVVFSISFFLTRLIIFPFWIVYSVLFESWQIIGPYRAWWLINGLLLVLQTLHIIWFYLIARIAVKAIFKGKVCLHPHAAVAVNSKNIYAFFLVHFNVSAAAPPPVPNYSMTSQALTESSVQT